MCQNNLWTLETIWKCIVWNVIKWWYFYTNIWVFFPLCLWEQSWNVGFEQIDVFEFYTLPSELQGISVGGRWVFLLEAECQLFLFFLFFFYFYYCLLGVLSNLCSGANFYDWCGILQKLLSAKLFNVISTKFLLMANPWRLDFTFKGSSKEMGPVRLNNALGSTKTDYFLGKRSGDVLPFAYQIITSGGTSISSLWALSQTKRELVARSRLENMSDFILEQTVKIIMWSLWTWNNRGGKVYKRNIPSIHWGERLGETYSISQILMTNIFLWFSSLGS